MNARGHNAVAPVYDVLIIGGGMVGSTLACALGDGPLSVALVERGTLDGCRPEAEPDLRVSAITPASRNVFAAVGAWDAMTAWRVGPYTDMHVWDAAGGASDPSPLHGSGRTRTGLDRRESDRPARAAGPRR